MNVPVDGFTDGSSEQRPKPRGAISAYVPRIRAHGSFQRCCSTAGHGLGVLRLALVVMTDEDIRYQRNIIGGQIYSPPTSAYAVAGQVRSHGR